ncbi:MAG: hypothetical protein GAK31_02270 [Stenotrophomonas maltophilia]|uniref:LysR substrate-binding domain-containing protein n=1 Tax=Stenotrophomonas maltophilia TaxID=40324 RepID=A0A7V8FFX7_STEMA|nr:MAG: hypothetical protein GAK31_02270 [Stenotrophomonas maltophilia]
MKIRLFEAPLDQQIKGLQDDLYDAGFSMAKDAGDGVVVTPAWEDELMVAVPARHPVLAFKQIPLVEVLRYPLNKLTLAAALTACRPSQPSETVDYFVAHPERIKEIQWLCKADRAKAGEELCRRAAEAANRRFFDDRPEQKSR